MKAMKCPKFSIVIHQTTPILPRESLKVFLKSNFSFHPRKLFQKLQNIGLGEALIQVSKRFAGTCEALTTAKFIHGFLEPENDILVSLIIENWKSQHFSRIDLGRYFGLVRVVLPSQGPIASATKEQLAAFFDTAIANMPIYNFTRCPNYFAVSISLPMPLRKWTICIWYRGWPTGFGQVKGHLFFNQNDFTDNIDKANSLYADAVFESFCCRAREWFFPYRMIRFVSHPNQAKPALWFTTDKTKCSSCCSISNRQRSRSIKN